jgi:rod shape-determining protein MreC
VASRDRTARVAVLGTSVQRSRNERRPSRGRSANLRRLTLLGLVVVALALLTVSFRSPTSGALHTVQGYGAEVLRPFEVAAQRVARPFRDAYDYVSGLSGAKSQNAKLKAQVRQLRAQAVSNEAAQQKYEDLARLMHFEQSAQYPKDFRPVNTTIISYPGGPFAQQVTIDAGRSSGIRINTPVVDADGLIGHVTNVGPTTARVTLLDDDDSVVTAQDLRTHVTGLIRNGPRGTLVLDQVSKEQTVKKGDPIVTRGTVDRRYPDLYPYGIPIGSVTQVGDSDIATYKTVEVTPYANLGALDAVAALVPTKRK